MLIKNRVHRGMALSCGPGITLQRHFSALPKFAHVESWFCGRKRRGKAALDILVNPCVKSVCSRSVAVGIMMLPFLSRHTSAECRECESFTRAGDGLPLLRMS